jgi:hypothetical protein
LSNWSPRFTRNIHEHLAQGCCKKSTTHVIFRRCCITEGVSLRARHPGARPPAVCAPSRQDRPETCCRRRAAILGHRGRRLATAGLSSAFAGCGHAAVHALVGSGPRAASRTAKKVAGGWPPGETQPVPMQPWPR